MIISVIALLSLIYYHGNPISESGRLWIERIIRFSLGFYVFKYFTKLFYDFHPFQYIKSTWPEGFLVLLITINSISKFFFSFPMIERFGGAIQILTLDDFFMLFIQAYLLVMVGVEIGKGSQTLPRFNLNPSKLFVLSFVVLIALGTALLMLPEMSVEKGSAPLLPALFTAISASCVTGLSLVDVSTYFTFKGHVVIMILMQLGGLNIIAFASIFAFFNKSGIGIRHSSILQQNFNIENLEETEKILKKIFGFTLLFEAIGTGLIYISWGQAEFTHNGQKLFYSLFHAISAFNNAGFSLFSNGLATTGIQNLPALHWVIAMLIVLGSLGFTVMQDVFSISKLRERWLKPWVHLKVGSKIAIYSSLILILSGSLSFVLLEGRGVMRNMGFWQLLNHSFFQSITARTAGFNTLDFNQFSTATLLVFLVLMFIGASPGSTGGGIKTTTFTLILMSAISTIRGKPRLEIYRSTVPNYLLTMAFSVFLFTLTAIFAGTVLLSITDPEIPLHELAFEQVSAFCTVGLSTGITADLSLAGKVIIMLSMFVGRVGTLTLAFALSSQDESYDYKYPDTTVMVG